MKEIRLEEMPAFAREVLARVPEAAGRSHACLVTLQGELGAGKTTFMQALAQELGIAETVQSPTFVLMKSYDISYKGYSALVHIDAYRFDAPEQFSALKPEALLGDPKNIVCIEWPERLAGVLPQPDVALKFAHQEKEGGGSRSVEMQ